MNNKHIIVFVDEGPDNIRPSLLLAPEVAASFGWSNGAVISQTEGMQATMVNMMYMRDRIKEMEQCKQEEAAPFEQQGGLPSVEVSEEFWVALREYRERCKQEEAK